MRFPGIEILKSDDGKRYFKNVKYPDIPLSESDIYIETVFGDRIDLISYEYYRTIDDYWIISISNDIPFDSIYIPAGTQLRIPGNTSEAKRLFNELNNIT